MIEHTVMLEFDSHLTRSMKPASLCLLAIIQSAGLGASSRIVGRTKVSVHNGLPATKKNTTRNTGICARTMTLL